MSLYDFPCEYCDGAVEERVLSREPIAHHRGIVVLEKVPIGVCNKCGAHYFAAAVMRRVEAILNSDTPPARTMRVPVETF